MPRRTPPGLWPLFLVWVAAGPAAPAQTRTWTGATGNWGAGASWVGGIPPTTTAESALLNGAGTLTLDANYSIGGMTFQGGTLNGAGTLTLGGAFDWTAGTIVGPGTIQANAGGSWPFTVGPGVAIDQRTVNLGGGTTTLTSILGVRNGAQLNVGPAATLVVGDGTSGSSGGFAADQNQTGGSITNAGTMRVNLAPSAITTMPATITLTNSGTLIFQGGGVDFRSPFVQTAGEFALRGGGVDTTNAAGFDLQGGALTGSGNIGGKVTTGNTAITTAFFGFIYISNDLVMSANTTLNLRLGATNPDKLQVAFGRLTLDGTVNVTDKGGFGAGSYVLIDYDTDLTDNGLVLGSLPAGYTGAIRIDTVNTRVMLDVTPVPEPAGVLAAGAVGLGLCRRVRRSV